MNPKLKVDVTDLFEAFTRTAADDQVQADPNFVPPGAPMPADFMVGGDESEKFQGIVQQQRADQARQEDANNALPEKNRNNPNPATQTAPYGQLVNASKEASGFRNEQARKHVTAGVLASIINDTLVGGNVVYKSASTSVTGTVIAVGDNEFAVIWEDKTASVERKSDYELVIKA